jgi:hypothetical protein
MRVALSIFMIVALPVIVSLVDNARPAVCCAAMLVPGDTTDIAIIPSPKNDAAHTDFN